MLTAEALQANIDWNLAFFKQVGQIGPKFQVEGTSPTNHSSCQETRCIDLLYGIGMGAKLSFVFSQFTHLMDRRTDVRLYDRQDKDVNEMLRLKTESRLLIFSPRRDRD